ncbi:MAG: hypothetical protein GX434_04430 [Peptococcaceae bacterium]|nr:hypothetical protein [Peptococcaceae bacterium]
MNVILFNKTVAQYVDQGYPAQEVLKQLIPLQLLPGIFEAVALYTGIALVLIAAGFINQRLAKLLSIVNTVSQDSIPSDHNTVSFTADEEAPVKDGIDSPETAPVITQEEKNIFTSGQKQQGEEE